MTVPDLTAMHSIIKNGGKLSFSLSKLEVSELIPGQLEVIENYGTILIFPTVAKTFQNKKLSIAYHSDVEKSAPVEISRENDHYLINFSFS